MDSLSIAPSSPERSRRGHKLIFGTFLIDLSNNYSSIPITYLRPLNDISLHFTYLKLVLFLAVYFTPLPTTPSPVNISLLFTTYTLIHLPLLSLVNLQT